MSQAKIPEKQTTDKDYFDQCRKMDLAWERYQKEKDEIIRNRRQGSVRTDQKTYIDG